MSWSACCGSLLRRPEQQVTVDVGEESGGARRDAAHIYSSGTRRGPLTAATGYRVTAVQDEGREKIQRLGISPSTTGLHQNQPTQDQGFNWSGPMIDVRRGEARDPYLAGITAYDESRDVLRTDFKSLPARVVPPVLKAEKGAFKIQARVFSQGEYVGYNSPFRRPRDASGPSRGPAETKGSVVARRFFERRDQNGIPGVEFYRCSSSE